MSDRRVIGCMCFDIAPPHPPTHLCRLDRLTIMGDKDTEFFRTVSASKWQNVDRKTSSSTGNEYLYDRDSTVTIYVKDWNEAKIGFPMPASGPVAEAAAASAPPAQPMGVTWLNQQRHRHEEWPLGGLAELVHNAVDANATDFGIEKVSLYRIST